MSKSKKDRMNFERTLLDEPIKCKRTARNNRLFLFALQRPLVPTPYVPTKPILTILTCLVMKMVFSILPEYLKKNMMMIRIYYILQRKKIVIMC